MRAMTLNADLGEDESMARTRALLGLVDLANIACGGHAGTAASMYLVIERARAEGVKVGAHPGLAGEFGRGEADVTPEALALLLVQQVGGFAAMCRTAGAKLHHVKLHGALYHAVERSSTLAQVYVETIGGIFPRTAIVAQAGGRVVATARTAGVRALAEVFAERGYRPDGSLVPRGEPGDLILDPREVASRVPGLRGDTICVHADSPNALRIARAVRRVIDGDRSRPRAGRAG
ncbi:MAG TPA: 5-oxoprolinase subunit PxpA [Chthoniobacterales bacterium]